MTRLITCDPGGWKHAAWALFQEDRLVRCNLFRAKDFVDLSWAFAHQLPSYVDECICEVPQIYDPRRQVTRQQDLIGLAVVSGAFAQSVRADKILYVKPREWKGGVPKKIHNKRVMSTLDREELDIVDALNVPTSLRHNVLDSIGIGLWRLRRLP